MENMIVDKTRVLNGHQWVINDEGDTDAIKDIMAKFVSKYVHNNWTLTIYNTTLVSSLCIDCSLSDMPSILVNEYIRRGNIRVCYIGENYLTNSYIVGVIHKDSLLRR